MKRLLVIRRLTNELELVQISSSKGPDQTQTDNRIYNVLVFLIFMLRAQGAVSEWHGQLKGLIQSMTAHQRDAMGFPNDWEQRAVWTEVAT